MALLLLDLLRRSLLQDAMMGHLWTALAHSALRLHHIDVIMHDRVVHLLRLQHR